MSDREADWPHIAQHDESLPEWADERVQTVYRVLCETEHPPTPAEHWEGWVARRIVAALTTPLRPEDVTEEEVEAALNQWFSGNDYWKREESTRPLMRAAIAAATNARRKA